MSKPEELNADNEHEYGPLYESRQKIHPRVIKGAFRQIKTRLMWAFLVLYHFSPWLPWDRGAGKPDQAILFDISGKRIYLFDLEIWPQDIYILTGLMVLAAVGLFLSASLAGRAWCGFACFQTIWTDLFMKVEAWVEGDRNARIRLDNTPMGPEKFIKRASKHVIWLAIALFFAVSFLWYFDDPIVVTQNVFSLNLGMWEWATLGTLMGMTYIMAGFAREQVCFYMCPYGRFQGVMFDDHSKVVTYEAWRGESRGKPGKNRDFSDRGHCVDCSMCVQVCPTGIDIRDGQQMECIGCGLCIDACDDVMEKFGLPKNLISWDSAKNITAREQAQSVEAGREQRLIRPRTLIYSGILIVALLVTAFGVGNRDMVEVSILKDRAPFFVRLSDGSIQNAYTVRVLNKETTPKTFEVTFDGAMDPRAEFIGQTGLTIEVPASAVVTRRLIVKGHFDADFKGKTPLSVTLKEADVDAVIVEETLFNGPK